MPTAQGAANLIEKINAQNMFRPASITRKIS